MNKIYVKFFSYKRSMLHKILSWIERQSRIVLILFGFVTILLLLPPLFMNPAGQASMDPSGKVFNLQKKVGDHFSPRTHIQTAVLEANDGDALTAKVLSELFSNEKKLIEADNNGELTPKGLNKDSFLYIYFNPTTQTDVRGLSSIAVMIDKVLRSHPKLNVPLEKANDEQVKYAIHTVLTSSKSEIIENVISVNATSEQREVLGEKIDWWISPAIFITTFSDNEKLGGGVYQVGISSEPSVLNKEIFDRKVQEILRGEQKTYKLWGIAIDVNLESEEEGIKSGTYITFTVIAALAIMGVALRSYWAVALTGIGLGVLIIWLKGISILLGIKGGLVNDMIVPIAMISFGVDFAVHTIRRIQQNQLQHSIDRFPFTSGMIGISGALVLAYLSNDIAFMANASSEIESVIYFGLAATIAISSAFIVLGIIVPLGFTIVTSKFPVDTDKSKKGQITNLVSGIGVAIGTGSSVIVMIAVNHLIGALMLFVIGLLSMSRTFIRMPKKVTKTITNDVNAVTAPMESPSNKFVQIITKLTHYRIITLSLFTFVTVFFTWNALKLEPSFNVEDFFDPDSDLVTGLDKTDIHLGERGGEPGTIFIEGKAENPEVIEDIKRLLYKLSENESIGKNSNGTPAVFEPHLVTVLEKNTSSTYVKTKIYEMDGIKITDVNLDNIPDSSQGIKAILQYSIINGVRDDTGKVIFTADRVKDNTRFNGSSYSTRINFAIPGTRDLQKTSKAWDTLNEDIQVLKDTKNISDYGVTGSPFTRKAGLDATTKSLQLSIPIATTATFILLLIFMRSLKYAVVTIIPILLVVIWLYGTMHILGFGLNLVTATIGAISIGVGIDYSIHMTERFREEIKTFNNREIALKFSIQGTGIALAASAASSIGGVIIMAFAPMPMFSSYGLLTAAMIAMAFAASVLVLPSLLLIVAPNSTK